MALENVVLYNCLRMSYTESTRSCLLVPLRDAGIKVLSKPVQACDS
jgi:hypothetical protein